MAVESKIAIARILADLNLAVRYGIASYTYIQVTWSELVFRIIFSNI